MVRHIEFTIDYDLTCWGLTEDFEADNQEYLQEHLNDFIYNNSSDLLDHVKINKIWYEEDGD